LTLLLTNVRSDVPQCFISISNYNSKFVLASNEKLINLFEGLEICRVNVVVGIDLFMVRVGQNDPIGQR
jgi:hypothetical protein